MSDHMIALAGITLLAAVVNGALGYGFSSITVPLTLLFLSNRLLNPALVLIEVVLNSYVLWVNRGGARSVLPRVWPIVIGLVPGVILGTAIVALVSAPAVKLGTFIILLPLILVQASGWRRPIQAERTPAFALGAGVGTLYAVTTISGPPLALAFNNQGLARQEFRAALGIVRLAESTMTAVAYGFAGLYSLASAALIPVILPSLLVGVPLGAWLIRRVAAETFRRVCMSFDAWVVGFGISLLLVQLKIASRTGAWSVLLLVVLIDAALLYRYFAARLAHSRDASAVLPLPQAGES